MLHDPRRCTEIDSFPAPFINGTAITLLNARPVARSRQDRTHVSRRSAMLPLSRRNIIGGAAADDVASGQWEHRGPPRHMRSVLPRPGDRTRVEECYGGAVNEGRGK